MNLMQDSSRGKTRLKVLAVVLNVLLLVSCELCSYASGAVYYVSPSGNNSYPGTEAQSWQTIQKAADTLVAGDMVYIKAGIYQEQVTPQNSGSVSNYITYAAHPSGTVTIDGTSITLSSGQDGLFNVSNKSYIKISGLEIKNARPNNNSNGIFVDSSSYITIEKNYTYNTVSSGISVWSSSNIIIDGNEVELACNDGEQECITVAITDTFEIKDNHVHDSGPGTNGGEGIDAKDGSSNGKIYNNHVHHLNNRLGIYIDSWNKKTSNIQVYQNKVHDIVNADGFTLAAERGGLLENISIYNNIAYNNGTCGISISSNGGPLYQHPMNDIKIINNTFYNNGKGTWGGGVYVENQDVQSAVIRNNICSRNLSFQISNEAGLTGKGLTVDHNLIDGYRGDTDEIRGTDYAEGDPLFLSASGSDFHLQGSSPAIDKGFSTDAPSDDYDGNARPYGSGYDIGAYEYGAGTITTTGPTTTIGPTITTTTTEDENGCCSLEEIYGEFSKETELLRYLRDNYLSKTPEGQEIIRLYYQWSPMIVKMMEEDEEFEQEVKETIGGVLMLITEETN